MVRRRRLVHDLRATASPGAAMFLRATAAVSLALVACSGDPGQTGAGEKPYTLGLVGDPDLTLHPGERRDLRILVAGEAQGPIANARVHFGFQQGEAAGGSLEAEEVTTDDSGIAAARFLAAGRPAAGPFHVVATAPGLRAGAVAFRLSVVALRRRLHRRYSRHPRLRGRGERDHAHRRLLERRPQGPRAGRGYRRGHF